MAKIKELLKILEILNDLSEIEKMTSSFEWNFPDNFLHIDCSISMIFKKWLVKKIINKFWVKALV